MVALKALPYADVRSAGTVGVIRERRGRGRPYAGRGIGRRNIQIGGTAGIVLQIKVQECSDEMRVDGVDAILAPHGIFEPIQIPKLLPHRVGRRTQTDGMSAALEG